jgi:hypothetical protein
MGYTAPPCFFESLPGHSNWSLPRLPLHMHAEEIIPTFSTSNTYIRLCLPKALHPGMTPDVGIVHNQQKPRPLGNSHLPSAKRLVSAPAGESDSSQGGRSIACTIPGQNSTPSSSLNNSGMADITHRMTVTPSATQRQSMITPTAMPGTSSRSPPAPGGTSDRLNASRSIQPRIRHC